MHLIWLIEDNQAFREATAQVLNSEPAQFTTQCFDSCEAGLKAMQKGPRPKVILLDVGLPGMDGIQGIQEFKKIDPEVTVLILTVFENDDKIFRAICSGASGYLLKSDPDVIASINDVIAGGAPMNRRIAKKVLTMFTKMAPVKKDYGLSAQQQAVLELMAQGLAKKQIAERLELSRFTVDHYVRFIYQKLHVNCQTAAVSLAIRDGLIPPQS
jgi:DNA-binding NarL/FixJ family response regulator